MGLFGAVKRPDARVEVDILPLCLAQFTRANEYQWRKTQGTANGECALVAIDGPQYSSDLLRSCCRCKVVLHDWYQCSAEITGYVLVATSGGNCVPENLTATPRHGVPYPPPYVSRFDAAYPTIQVEKLQ
jgi:hypothetical protein